VLPGDVFTRQMLERHHRAALLAHRTSVPAWQGRETVSYSNPARRHGSRLRRFVLRLRPAHGGV